MENPEAIIIALQNCDGKFRAVCSQLVLLDNQMRDCQVRHDRATQRLSPAFRYSLRLRLVTLEKVRSAYWRYMDELAETVDDLQELLLGHYGINWDDIC